MRGCGARAGRRDVLGVLLAKAAHAAERCQTLFEGDEAAICSAASIAAAVYGAPRIVLRLCVAAQRSRAEDDCA
jgi:hypothetical protein